MKIRDYPRISKNDIDANFSIQGSKFNPTCFLGSNCCQNIGDKKIESYYNYKTNPQDFSPKLYQIDEVNFIGGVWVLYSDYYGFKVNLPALDYSHRLFFENYSKIWNTEHSIKLERLPGLSCLLNGQWANDYYHFLWETMSKFYLVGKSVNVGNIDRFIVGQERKFYIEQIFQYLNIPKEKIFYSNHSETYSCEQCIIPTQLTNTAEIAEEYCSFLNEKLIIKNLDAELPTRLYIGRRGRRRIINEEQVLYPILHEQNFCVVNLEDYNFLDQINILKNAEIVIGPHGAGLANKIFGKTKTIEIVSKTSNNTCFLNHSSLFGIDHYHLTVDEYEGNLRMTDKNITELKRFLQEY